MTDIRNVLIASNRRDFLRTAALGGAGLALLPWLSACNSDDLTDPSLRATFALNQAHGPINAMYAHVLLMYDFYSRVRKHTVAYPGQTAMEGAAFSRLWQEKELQARAFRVLVPAGRIQDTLYFSFGAFNFTSRESVLGFAAKFEDLGVALCNGLAPHLREPADLLVVGQMASVGARHACLVRDIASLLLPGKSRSGLLSNDVIAANGTSVAMDPAQAMREMQPYFVTELSVR